ncbi:MAG: hypothetical protein Q8S73_17775 [Deltaproteobacteria bacterium]|nr:hypothetical protein [Myxococcales bacterium]MDP3215961.1 hypothetical protein [Deltaproteobacteria bacterium]
MSEEIRPKDAPPSWHTEDVERHRGALDGLRGAIRFVDMLRRYTLIVALVVIGGSAIVMALVDTWQAMAAQRAGAR